MDQTRYTLVGIFITTVLAIIAGFGAQWYAAGARPAGTGADGARARLLETSTAVTATAALLPTPIQTQAPPTPTPSTTPANAVKIIDSDFNPFSLALGWSLIAYDDFANNQAGWGTGPSSGKRATGQRQVTDGLYLWKLTTTQSLNWSDAAVGAPFEQFMVTVEVEKDSAEVGNSGLIFRQQDYNNYFQYSLCAGNQSYELWHRLQGNWTSIIKCSATNAANLDGTNILTVIGLGEDYFLYINDVLVDQFTNSSFEGGFVGVSIDLDADQTNQFKFDNFELRANR